MRLIPREAGRLTTALGLLLAATLATTACRGDPAPPPTPVLTAPTRPVPPPGRTGPTILFRPAFPASGLVTNEYAYRHPDRPDSRTSADWVVTSGSLFARDGAGWTGPVDHRAPGAVSAAATNSGTFRLVSRRRDFADVSVTARVRLVRTTSTGSEHAYDGIHLWLRYVSPDQLYAVTLTRRDGRAVIKRKVTRPGQADAYTDLAATAFSAPLDNWITATAAVTDTPAGPRLTLSVAGQQILSTVDRSADAIRHPGGIGFRGDNTEFEFRDVTVATAR
jgi:hypothetical protein